MNKMKTMKIGVVLLALLLAGIAMVPMVFAEKQSTNSASPDQMSVLTPDISKTPLPQLQFDKSQMYVKVDNELSPDPNIVSSQINQMKIGSQNLSISKFPYGSIIYHSNDGITTVFTADGKQLFAALDAKAALVNTPKGPRPATGIHDVPSGSVVSSDGKITTVIYQDKLLFKEIDEKLDTKQTPSLITPLTLVNPPSYVEGIEGTPTSQNVGQYSALWTVPTNPSNTNPSGGPIYLFDGVQTVTGRSLLIQPVLEWHAETQNAWSIASWFMYSSTNGVHSTRKYGVSTGHQIQGQMTYNAPGVYWNIGTIDNSNGLSTYLTVSNSMPNSGVEINLWLESWQTGLNRYMPSSTTFNNFIVRDTNNNNIRPSSITPVVQQSYWPQLTGLGVTNNWPTSITLRTNTQ
jgi:hypothetical protein